MPKSHLTPVTKTVTNQNGTSFEQRYWTAQHATTPQTRPNLPQKTVKPAQRSQTTEPAALQRAVVNHLVATIQQHLTPDLLKPKYRNPETSQHPHTGHCYVATEALYHLWGKQHGAKPMRMKVGDDVHWWLEHPSLGVIDPTAKQFPFPVEYEKGKGGGFLTREPSARAQILMTRLKRT